MLSIVSAMSLWSLRFAPSIVRPTGTPAPSVRRLRLVPSLPRSVGLGPVLFPPARSLGHAAVQSKPVPLYPFGVVVSQETLAPEFVEDPGIEPFAKSAVGRRARTDSCRIQGIPLTASPQHEENRGHRTAIGNPRVVASKRM